MTMISPGRMSLSNFAPTAASAQLSDAMTYAPSSVFPKHSGRKPRGSLAAISFAADMMTSEITALRRSLDPVVERICELWLRVHGYGGRVEVRWDDINLQDQVEEARAELYREQARAVRGQNSGR